MQNVLLIIVDCLRLDRVTPTKMPKLFKWGADHIWYTNYWSTSHCTDPVLTHMLSGRHPDSLGLYSMMYEHKYYTIPDNVRMIAQDAKDLGYETGFVTNIGRWYRRGVDTFVDCRHWLGNRIFGAGIRFMNSNFRKPWFLIVHTDDMHREYTGGNYDRAAWAVDNWASEIISLAEAQDAAIFVTADHGEGLGEKGIQQHGHGLWAFLTHVPLLSNILIEDMTIPDVGLDSAGLYDPGSLYNAMKQIITDDQCGVSPKEYVFQAGDTPPNIRHRGIVSKYGEQVIFHYVGDDLETVTYLMNESSAEDMTGALINHLSAYGLKLEDGIEKEAVVRLKGLGYFSE